MFVWVLSCEQKWGGARFWGRFKGWKTLIWYFWTCDPLEGYAWRCIPLTLEVHLYPSSSPVFLSSLPFNGKIMWTTRIPFCTNESKNHSRWALTAITPAIQVQTEVRTPLVLEVLLCEGNLKSTARLQAIKSLQQPNFVPPKLSQLCTLFHQDQENKFIRYFFPYFTSFGNPSMP